MLCCLFVRRIWASNLRAGRRLLDMSATEHSPPQTYNQGTGGLFPAEKRATPCGSRGAGTSSTLLPVDDAEHQTQVLSDARVPPALQLLGYASAAQCAAGARKGRSPLQQPTIASTNRPIADAPLIAHEIRSAGPSLRARAGGRLMSARFNDC